MGAKIAGATNSQINRFFGVNESTIRKTIKNAQNNNTLCSRPRSGRPKCYSERDERILLRHVRHNPFDTYASVAKATGLEISINSIKAILSKHGISNWRAKKRPTITDEHAATRLLWARIRSHWTVEQWRNYMWSDECSAERGKGKSGVWVFRTPTQKWDRDKVQVYNKGKDISVMVWACFWGNPRGGIGRSELYILDRDFESKKHGYSARSYLEVLEDQIHKCWEPGLRFMQDNASIHTAKEVRQWFQDLAIPVVDWPPYSPDLNPIEHVWIHLKKMVLEMHPELEGMGAGKDAIAALESALKEAWNALPDSLFESLIESMPRRVAAVIAAEGWHTKY